MLFFTNIIAIALGTAITFWAVGISTFVDAKDTTRTVQTWPRYVFLGFVLISFLLAVFMEIDQFTAAAERNADAAGSNIEAIFSRPGAGDPIP